MLKKLTAIAILGSVLTVMGLRNCAQYSHDTNRESFTTFAKSYLDCDPDW
nr:hypothetical protein GPGIFMOB_00331 [Acinetobacter gerneri]